jgi:hypothetical protein
MTLPTPAAPPDRHRIAAEVVELGQTLFDAVLDAAAQQAPQPQGDKEATDPFPGDELRGAADEFFRAVKRLLDLPTE